MKINFTNSKLQFLDYEPYNYLNDSKDKIVYNFTNTPPPPLYNVQIEGVFL